MTAPALDRTPSRLVATVILAACGAAAALASWAVLIPTSSLFLVVPKITLVSGAPMPPGDPKTAAATRRGVFQRLAVQGALVGACCGAFLGLGVGLTARSVRGVLVGLLGGLVLTAAFGALGGVALKLVSEGSALRDPSLRGIAAHAVLWGVLSIGTSLAIGGATRAVANVPTALLAGVLAGVLGAVLVQVLGESLFMGARTTTPIPGGDPHNLVRILWVAAWSVTYGAMLGRTLAFQPATTVVTSSASAPPAVPAGGTAAASPPGSTRTP